MGSLAERRQEFVEQRNGRVRVDGCAGAQRFFPAGLQSVLQVVAHPVRGVGIEPTHAGHLVAQALLGQDLRDAPNASGEHPGYDWRAERAANEFAANLLMPASMVRRAAATSNDVTALAAQFHVSRAAMGFRLTALRIS